MADINEYRKLVDKIFEFQVNKDAECIVTRQIFTLVSKFVFEYRGGIIEIKSDWHYNNILYLKMNIMNDDIVSVDKWFWGVIHQYVKSNKYFVDFVEFLVVHKYEPAVKLIKDNS